MATSRDWEEYIHKKNSGHKNPTSHIRRYSRRPRDMEDVSGSTRLSDPDAVQPDLTIPRGGCCINMLCTEEVENDWSENTPFRCEMTTEQQCDAVRAPGLPDLPGRKCGVWNEQRTCGDGHCVDLGACCDRREVPYTCVDNVKWKRCVGPRPQGPNPFQDRNDHIGEWQGPGTVCSETCRQPDPVIEYGACCLPELCGRSFEADSIDQLVSKCQKVPYWVCDYLGGTWYRNRDCAPRAGCPWPECGTWHNPLESGGGSESG